MRARRTRARLLRGRAPRCSHRTPLPGFVPAAAGRGAGPEPSEPVSACRRGPSHRRPWAITGRPLRAVSKALRDEPLAEQKPVWQLRGPPMKCVKVAAEPQSHVHTQQHMLGYGRRGRRGGLRKLWLWARALS